MAHNLMETAAGAAMAYIDATPWHKLGQRLNLREMAREAMLDAAIDAALMRYQVASVPMFLADGTEITGHKAAVRLAADGSVAATFGPVGDNHKHIQNEAACEILRPMIEEFGAVPAALGALANGARCWVLLRLADATVTPVDGDDVNGYFLLHWGHDGQIALTGLGTTVRVVCQNTLSMATNAARGGSWFKVRHTSSAQQRLDEAAQLVRRLGQAMQATGDTFAALARKALTPDQLAAYVAAAIPDTGTKPGQVSPVIEARRETIVELARMGRGAVMASQLVPAGQVSVWAAVNAITEYFDHVRPAEATNDSGLRRASESAIFGGNADIKVAALAEARRLLAA